jgi:polar amino acid transport system substrate-binding protein
MAKNPILSLALILSLCLGYNNSPQPTIAAELAEIQRRGKLIVAVKDNLRPLGFTDAEGNLQGLEIDLARHLAAELLGDPNAVIFHPVANQDRLNVLLNDQVDLVIARLTVTPSRSRVVDFSNYYYFDGTGLITKDTSIQNLQSFKKIAHQTIAVLNNSSSIAVILHDLPHAQLIGVDSYQEAKHLLESNLVVAFAADRSILTGWVQEDPQYHLLPERLSGEPLAVAMLRGLQYEPLRQRVNQAIMSWQQSGWLQDRINYWGLP